MSQSGHLVQETLVRLSAAAELFPAVEGKHPTRGTIWRWAIKGVRGVRLESTTQGGVKVTSREAIARFQRAVAETDLPEPAPKLPSRARTRGALHAREERRAAKAYLDHLGI